MSSPGNESEDGSLCRLALQWSKFGAVYCKSHSKGNQQVIESGVNITVDRDEERREDDAASQVRGKKGREEHSWPI